MAKSGGNQIWGVFGLFLGCFIIYSGSNLFRKDDAFSLKKGILKADAQLIESSSRRGRDHYEFRLTNHFYKKLIFSNSELYDMKSGIDYPKLLKKGAKVRFHVLKKDFHHEMVTKIFSLEVEGKSIVKLAERTSSDWKGFALGIFLLLGGLLLIFD